jgi:hypothetical protein
MKKILPNLVTLMLQHSRRYRRCVFCKQKRFRFITIFINFTIL